MHVNKREKTLFGEEESISNYDLLDPFYTGIELVTLICKLYFAS